MSGLKSTIERTRLHVYAQSDGDFLFIGNAQMRTRGGCEFKEEFIGRLIVDDPSNQSPRVKFFTVWIVSLPLCRSKSA